MLPADGLIEIMSLDENGKVALNTDLPFGSYYVQEISTDCNYILSDEKYPVVFGYEGVISMSDLIASSTSKE